MHVYNSVRVIKLLFCVLVHRQYINLQKTLEHISMQTWKYYGVIIIEEIPLFHVIRNKLK